MERMSQYMHFETEENNQIMLKNEFYNLELELEIFDKFDADDFEIDDDKSTYTGDVIGQ